MQKSFMLPYAHPRKSAHPRTPAQHRKQAHIHARAQHRKLAHIHARPHIIASTPAHLRKQVRILAGGSKTHFVDANLCIGANVLTKER